MNALRLFLAGTAMVWLIGCTATASPPKPEQAERGLHVHPCVSGHTKVPSECGTFGVYENRLTNRGRIIQLHFVILKARHPSNRAIYWNPGGPGVAAVPAAPFFADGLSVKELSALRDRYNIILLDNRGIGASHSLNCDLYSRSEPQTYFGQLWPDKALAACRTQQAARSDLNMYITNFAADDLDDLRAALGYTKLVLDGDSYGTFTSLIFMRRHPNSVESAILDGVAPPHILVVPLQDPQGGQLAMERLAAECLHDARCNREFPQFAEHFATLARRFDRGPVKMQARGQHGYTTVLLSREVFADRLRQTLYTTQSGAYVPYIIERAYAGDYGPLATMVDVTTHDLAQIVEMTTNLSYACAEQVPFVTESAIARTSANTFMGDTRVRAQQRACSIWNVKALPASFDQPVRSNAPVLMISGSDDAASPPSFAAEQLRYLPNGRRALVQGAAHVTETACTDHLKIAFVLAASTKDLDVDACSSSYQRPPFAASMKGFQ